MIGDVRFDSLAAAFFRNLPTLQNIKTEEWMRTAFKNLH